MSTKKDLVEAHAFSRRRLVTAFVSGAPGGREVEPSRPGRTIVGGVALGVLVLAGGAIAGVFSGRPPEGWLDPGLVAAGGSLYAITEESDDPELRPVDPISGRLIFGADAEPSEVSAEEVAQQRTGSQIGIAGAPSALPSEDLLVDEGWVSCTADGGGIETVVADPPPAQPVPGAGVVVRSGDETWLIASGAPSEPDPQAFRFLLPENGGPASQVLDLLGLPSVISEVPEVDDAWLNLWPEGPALRSGSFDLGASGPVPGSEDWFEGLDTPLTAGDVVEIPGGSPHLVTADGPAPLSDFAADVYSVVGDGEVLDADRITAPTVTRVPADWPDGSPSEVTDGSLCAMLVPRVDDTPTVLVADGFEGNAELAEAGATTRVVVQEGRGAFVFSGGSDGVSTPFVIDGRGLHHLVEGGDAVEALGYGSHDTRLVPDTWLELFGCGVALSRDAALRPPEPQDPDEGDGPGC